VSVPVVVSAVVVSAVVVAAVVRTLAGRVEVTAVESAARPPPPPQPAASAATTPSSAIAASRPRARRRGRPALPPLATTTTPWTSGRSVSSFDPGDSGFPDVSDPRSVADDGAPAPGPPAAPPAMPRAPSLLDALLPVLVLIGLIALTIALFGVSATDGPLQVALLLSATFAGMVALKNGYTSATIADAAVGGVATAMGAVFILLAVGALIGTWNMAGTIPTVVDYGLRLLNPTIFFVTTAAICAVVGLATGSSWTTAGTLGVAFVAMAKLMGLSEEVAAGAVICGAYFGDKMTPLSETTILVPRLVGGGLTVSQHVRNMVWTAGPALAISLVVFLFLGLSAHPAAGVSSDAALDILGQVYNISAVNLLPLVLLVLCTLRRVPPFLAIISSALFAGILACFTQWSHVQAFVGEPGLGTVATGIKAIYAAMATGFESRSGYPAVDELFSRGGMASFLTTIWLVIAALSFAAIMEHAGFLERLLRPIVARARSRGQLILAVNASGVGLNVVAGDQYVADVLPARLYRTEFARRGLAPQALSRAVEDSGTVTSVLVPWNTCGAYIAGVLGVSTASYLPYCFFNLLSPILDVVYGFLGFKVPTVAESTAEPAPEPSPTSPAPTGAA
jgi:NhaC family Na+:H+ antiporter